ncbi:MAG: NUDIX domain-containing protein [Thaumarchaeota archaeon]|nr:NUDIX domain-containing protein [Candidatus Geocrenenecus arthurdayi]
MKAGESPDECALRELEEETSYKAGYAPYICRGVSNNS